LTAQCEDLLDSSGVDVGDQFTVDEVVTRLGTVDPASFFHGAFVAHLHVLGELLAKELGEGAEDVVEHATRGR
jgi:hypothetical protein